MIGGELELLPPPRGYVPYRLDEALGLGPGHFALFRTAREATRWWIDHQKPPGAMLLPAYCCDSVVQPFRQAGIPCSFYPVDRSLVPLAGTLDTTGHAAVQVIHHFGFPAPEWLYNLCLPVLEDRVQALLSQDPPPRGDWQIASLRKFLPTPDGAFLASRQPFPEPRLPDGDCALLDEKWAARKAKAKALAAGDPAAWEQARLRLLATEDQLDQDPVRPAAMTARSRAWAGGYPLGAFARKRRENYRSLAALLPDGLAWRPELPAGVVPYGLPILVEERNRLKQWLEARGIITVVHWALPPEITREEHPDSHWLADHILTLPIDQRYGPGEMAQIAEAIGTFYG